MALWRTRILLPAIIGSSSTFTPDGYGEVTPAHPVFLDLGPGGDFPPAVGPNDGIPIGEGTIYQFAAADSNSLVNAAWTLHQWKSGTIAGSVVLASQQFVGFSGAVAAVYRHNPDPDPHDPVGGYCNFDVSTSFPSTVISPHTTGRHKWTEFSGASFLGRSIFYNPAWPGSNFQGNVDTAAQNAGFDLDWVFPVSPLEGPALPDSPASFGDEIYRISVGDYNFYIGSEISSWDGDPATIPTPVPVNHDLVIRCQLYGNCGCTRRKDDSGTWLYPNIFAAIVAISIEPSPAPTESGYYGSPPIAPDTDGMRATVAGYLPCATFLTSGTFSDSGVSIRMRLPPVMGGGYLGDASTHNYSESFPPSSLSDGDNGWGAIAGEWKSHGTDLVISFEDPVPWGLAPDL